MRRHAIGIAFLPFLFSIYAEASLGGRIITIDRDRSALRGDARVLERQSPEYSVHELSLPEGQRVREYVDARGTVFAVTWRGVAQPDLSVLLGDHYAEFQSAEAASPPATARRARPSSTFRSGDLIVVRSGHMRDVQGKAYLDSQLPRQLKAQDLR